MKRLLVVLLVALLLVSILPRIPVDTLPSEGPRFGSEKFWCAVYTDVPSSPEAKPEGIFPFVEVGFNFEKLESSILVSQNGELMFWSKAVDTLPTWRHAGDYGFINKDGFFYYGFRENQTLIADKAYNISCSHKQESLSLKTPIWFDEEPKSIY